MKFAIMTGIVKGEPKIIAGPSADVDAMKQTMKTILDNGGKHDDGKKSVTFESVSIDMIGGRTAIKRRKC